MHVGSDITNAEISVVDGKVLVAIPDDPLTPEGVVRTRLKLKEELDKVTKNAISCVARQAELEATLAELETAMTTAGVSFS